MEAFVDKEFSKTRMRGNLIDDSSSVDLLNPNFMVKESNGFLLMFQP